MSTVVLILKAIAPFLKEILFKDKRVVDLIKAHRIASYLAGLLICVTIGFIWMVDVSETHRQQAQSQSDRITWLEKQSDERQERIEYLEAVFLPKRPDLPTPQADALPQPSLPTTPPPQVPQPEVKVVPPQTTGPSPKVVKPPRKKTNEDDLKSYTKSLLDDL